MLKEFEGIIGLAGLHQFGEKCFEDRVPSEQLRFRAVVDTAFAESILFAIAFGQRRQALRILLESCISFERHVCLPEPLPKTTAIGFRPRPKLELVK